MILSTPYFLKFHQYYWILNYIWHRYSNILTMAVDTLQVAHLVIKKVEKQMLTNLGQLWIQHLFTYLFLCLIQNITYSQGSHKEIQPKWKGKVVSFTQASLHSINFFGSLDHAHAALFNEVRSLWASGQGNRG